MRWLFSLAICAALAVDLPVQGGPTEPSVHPSPEIPAWLVTLATCMRRTMMADESFRIEPTPHVEPSGTYFFLEQWIGWHLSWRLAVRIDPGREAIFETFDETDGPHMLFRGPAPTEVTSAYFACAPDHVPGLRNATTRP